MEPADPDLPVGIALPGLSVDPPSGIDAGGYRRLRLAFDALPRRSRVVIALRMPPPGRRRLTLRAIAALFGVGHERIRQLEARAVWKLSYAWRQQSARGLSLRERVADLAPVVGAALDRYPLDGGDPAGGSR